jgi:DNA-directed RNA polymerase I subunit RPA1
MCKYVAKFRLLERGLLEAAQGVDDIQLRVRKRKAKTNGGHDEEEAEETGLPDETPQQFMTRVNLYVAIHLSRARESTRDDYKDSLVYQSRKELVSDFLKNILLRKCLNGDCNSCVLTLFKFCM